MFLEKLRAEKRKKNLEKDLATAMHQAAILSTYLPPDEVIKSLSEGNTVLAEEFRHINLSIGRGEDPEIALRHIAKKSGSVLFEKAADILAMGYRTGADISEPLIKIGDEISLRLQAQRERDVSLTIQKYTLLASAGFIVPLLLGIVSSFSQSMAAQFSGFDIGMGTGNDALISSAILGSRIYAAICAVLSSFFVTYLENKRWFFAVVYAAVLLPCSLVLYGVAGSLV